jgi:hypothetical protein
MDRLVVVLAATVALVSLAAAQELSGDARARAEQLWARYVALDAAFDPAVADLYADDAVIRDRRLHATGSDEVSVPGALYKTLLRRAISTAKARNAVNQYSDCSYAAVRTRVRIVCTRFSALKGSTSPVSLLVGPGPSGEWRIFEEKSESRP